jgi:hypothetical protein
MLAFADVLGFLLTVVVLLFLGTGGYVASILSLGDRAETELATVAIETLVGATALALAIGLALGAAGVLEIVPALGVLFATVIALLAIARRKMPPRHLEAPLRALASRLAELAREHPAITILAANALFAESAFALLHPPLSWDSIEYHLLLAAHWFHRHDLAPFLGAPRLHVQGMNPAAGSVYLWWWLASAHSDLYVNLAYVPHWVLLGVVAYSLARRLGATRFAPLAGATPLFLPVILRWATTQYADILMTSMLLAGLHFLARFAANGARRDAAWAGVALGVALGAKGLGVPYVFSLALPAIAWMPRPMRDRTRAFAIAASTCALLGAYFYVRNALVTGSPFFPFTALSFGRRVVCDPATFVGPGEGAVAGGQIAYRLGALARSGTLFDAFLGSPAPTELESGVGPAFACVIVGLVALPWSAAREQRWLVRTIAVFVVFTVLVWLFVPYARGSLVFLNIRYLDPTLVLGSVAFFAWLDRRGLSPQWASTIAILIAAQGVLAQTVLLAWRPRRVLFAIDALVIGAAVSTRARGFLRRRAKVLAAIALAAFAAYTPWFAEFRDLDRARAYGDDLSGHETLAYRHARAWAWLDSNGRDGTVAFVSAPLTYFYYPAMGMRLDRRVTYVNADAQDGMYVTDFPRCHLRDHPDRDAWLRRLDRDNVRWLLVSRYPPASFPIEAEWARALSDAFVLRYSDTANLLFERVRAPNPDPRS